MLNASKPTKRNSLLAAAIVGSAILGSAAIAQVAINTINNGTVIVKGKIADTFGDKFVLEDSSGRILVQTGPGSNALAVKTGDTVTVIGLPRERTFDASQILRENGEVVFAAPSQQANVTPAQLPAVGGFRGPQDDPRIGAALDRDAIARVIQQAGLTGMGEPVRHPKHIELPARTAAGKLVIVSLDRFGRLDEIEDADHDKKRISESQAISMTEVDRLARQAGYSPREPVERRKHHFEIVATGPKGEMMEVHMDLSGNIYKQIWIR